MFELFKRFRHDLEASLNVVKLSSGARQTGAKRSQTRASAVRRIVSSERAQGRQEEKNILFQLLQASFHRFRVLFGNALEHNRVLRFQLLSRLGSNQSILVRLNRELAFHIFESILASRE